MSLSPPVLIIAGMGAKLGLACARQFGRAGFRVGMIARRENLLDGYVRALADECIESTYAAADVLDRDGLDLAMEKIAIEYGAPSVVVSNAYNPTSGRATTLDMRAARSTVDTSIIGSLNVANAALPMLIERGSGTMLFTGSKLAVTPDPQDLALSVAMAAQRAMALALAQDHERDGLHIATVTVSGPIEAGTPFDPAKVAKIMWQLHHEPAGSWTREWIVTGAPLPD